MSKETERFQTMGTILALVISIIAMITSIYEANIMKSQQTAMVWPYIDVTQQYSDEGFGFRLENKGTGPAIIKSVQISFKGEPMETIDELMDALNPKRTFGYDIMTNNSINGKVISANERIIIFGLPHNDETRVVQSNLQYLRLELGYESVLGDKWVYDSKDESHNEVEKFELKTEFKN